ncbi:MAG: barstar family protein [Planctomycetota bacterium]|jgi:RNAse (barnase) inhibitor barstar
MAQKKRFIIDGSRFDTLETFYDEVERILCPDLSFQWGRNLDAFNDILSGGFGSFEYEEPIDLIWKHAEKSKTDLGYEETVRCLRKWLWRCHLANRSHIKEEIRQAKQGNGQTIFDMLIEIIEENTHINLLLDRP